MCSNIHKISLIPHPNKKILIILQSRQRKNSSAGTGLFFLNIDHSTPSLLHHYYVFMLPISTVL